MRFNKVPIIIFKQSEINSYTLKNESFKSSGAEDQGKRVKAGRRDTRLSLTLIHLVVGHDGDALLPHHADVGPVSITCPEEHGQQDGLSDGAPEHTQHHPVVGAVKLQAGKAHHLHRVREKIIRSVETFDDEDKV